MPTYEYVCRKCDATFDVYYRSFAESDKAGEVVACEKCGAKKAERVFSVFGTRSASGGGSVSPSNGGGGGSCCGGGGCGCG